MKKLILFLIISVGLNAQFNYQAIVKDSDGNPVTNNGVSFRFSLMYQSSTATPVYVEEHTVTTPPDGINNLSIGGGTVVNGIFSDIDWSQSVFMKEELDTGNGYQDMGTRKVTSVPVAEFAKNSGSSISSLTFVDSSNNLAIGTSVSLDGERNVAIGVTALADEISNAKYNVGIGYGALSNITSGTGNIAIGDSSLYLLNNGNNNLAIGDVALYNNLSDNNIGVGTGSLANNVSGTQNIGIGTGALYNNSDGSVSIGIGYNALYGNNGYGSNIAIGDEAMYSSSNISSNTGSWNIAIGGGSLRKNSTGDSNIAIGNSAMYSNTTGGDNIALGSQTLSFNTIGHGNVAIGGNALRTNTTGFDNIALGNSLSSNTSGTANIAIGTGAIGSNISGDENIAIGRFALNSNTTGYYNISIGKEALSKNVTGTYNVAVGIDALRNNTASRNTALGSLALRNNTTGTINTAVGFYSLVHNETGGRNVGLGDASLYYNEDGSYNVALGNLALTNNVSGSSNVSIGDASLYNSISSSNVGLGSGAGYDLNTENSSENTFIGYNANTVSGTFIYNSTAIGARAVVTTSNTIQLGDTNVTLINTSGTVSAASYKGSGDELEITVNGVITSLVSKILELEDKISSLESGSTSMNSSLTFLERYDGTFWEVYSNNTSGDTSINFIGIKNDPNGLFIERIFIEEYSDLQRLGDCYQIVVGESTRYDSDGEREDFDVTIIENSSEKLIFELTIGYYDGESTIQEYDRLRVQLTINNNQLTETVVDLDVTDTDVTTFQSSIYNYEDLCDNYNFLLNEYNYTNIPFEKYYDLETQSTCGSCDSGAYAQFDLRFSAGSGDIRARMSWNEQYTNVALVGDKSFDEVTYSDIPNYYFCEHINDDNSACDNSDNPPTDFIGIYMTYEGNYYLVQYISETDNDVKFKYKLLRQ